MSAVNVVIKKTKAIPGQSPMRSETPYDHRYGFYGMVTEVHPKTLTVNVRMDTGREISGVRVASREWVTIDTEKDYLTGERDLPPVDSFVFCLMPSGEPTSALVLCSVFAYQDSMGGGITEFKEKSEDAKFIDKRVDSGGWLFTHDKRTGTRRIQNAPKIGDETISLEIDQEEKGKEKATITIHGNTFTVDKENGVQLETDKNVNQKIEGDYEKKVKGKHSVAVDGDYKAEVKGKTDISADKDMSFKCKKNGLLELGNTVATLGKMVSDLLQAGISFKSVGSPATHTAPDFSAKCAEIKAKWDQVFK